MFGRDWFTINPGLRGGVLMFFGVVLLLHTLGVLQKWLDWILIFFALVMIIYGFIDARVWQRVNELLEQRKTQDKPHKDS